MATKVKYPLNLRTILDRAYTNKNTRNRLRRYITDPLVKRTFGFNVIEEMVNRTQNENIDKKDRGFKNYSKSYKESDTFKIYGKSDDVNMTLTGEMLSSMDVENTGATTINIYFVDQENNDKAHGHIHGTRHKKTGTRMLPVRDFFGLTKEREDKILKATLRNVVLETRSLEIAEAITEVA